MCPLSALISRPQILPLRNFFRCGRLSLTSFAHPPVRHLVLRLLLVLLLDLLTSSQCHIDMCPFAGFISER